MERGTVMAESVWVAEFDSRSFTFTAVDKTRDLAVGALRRGLRKWAEMNDLAEDWFAAYEDGFVVVRVPIGACMVDMDRALTEGRL